MPQGSSQATITILDTPTPLFTSVQTLGNTTVLEVYPTNLAVPVAVAGAGGATNPVGIISNVTHGTTLLLRFAVDANNAKVAFDVTGFSEIAGKSQTSYIPQAGGAWLRTKYFLGEAQGGNISTGTGLGATAYYLVDNFTAKTFAPFNVVGYIEPADDLSTAVIAIDVRGSQYVMVRCAQGTATAATKVQVWYGFN